VLSALRAAALLSLDPNAAQAFRFLAVYRRRTRRPFSNPLLYSPSDVARRVRRPNLSTGPATAMPTPAPGSKKKKKQNFAGHKWPSQSDVEVGAAAPKTKRRRKNKNSTGQEHHFQNPVALVLDFAQGTPPPSRDELLSTFCKFGYVIHSETAILSARVVFATRAEAEAAYSCAQTLGPFATPRLQDLPLITLNNASLPLPKLPLKDVRNNLEKMILSLTARSSSPQEAKSAMGNLLREIRVFWPRLTRCCMLLLLLLLLLPFIFTIKLSSTCQQYQYVCGRRPLLYCSVFCTVAADFLFVTV
jgi:hypothetical protein